MAPLIPNGIYLLQNGQYTSQAAEKVGFSPFGSIHGAPRSLQGPNQKWTITNVGQGGNQITIRSLSHGTYAYAEEYQGAMVEGSYEPMVWTVVKVDSGMYYLQSPDGDYVWELPKANWSIILVKHTGQANTKWRPIHAPRGE